MLACFFRNIMFNYPLKNLCLRTILQILGIERGNNLKVLENLGYDLSSVILYTELLCQRYVKSQSSLGKEGCMSHTCVNASKLLVLVQSVCGSSQMGEYCEVLYLPHNLMTVASCGW